MSIKPKIEQIENLNETIEELKAEIVELQLWPQSGSNEYGNWIKYRDGTMICWGTAVDVPADGMDILWPQEFFNIPSAVISSHRRSYLVTFGMDNIKEVTTIGAYVSNQYSSVSSGDWQAIGRWKE